MPYGSIGCTYHLLKYSSPNRSKTNKQEPHQRAYLLENGGLGKNKSGKWAKSRKRIRATGPGRRTKEDIYIEKWDQTESPESPDRGKTSEIPGLPSGGHQTVRRKSQTERRAKFKSPSKTLAERWREEPLTSSPVSQSWLRRSVD